MHANSAATAIAKAQRGLECIAVALFALLLAFGLWRLAVAAGWRIVPLLALVVPLAWLAADLLSGLLHWAFDSFGSVHTPLIGRAFIRPFREHHVDPAAMTRHDFVETHGASCLAALPLLGATSVMALDSLAAQLVQALLLSIALAALATNQCHQWAHMDDAAVPAAVRWAQRHRLVLPPWQHRLHHTAPFDSHFCVLGGWGNACMDAVLRVVRRRRRVVATRP
jgi:ubiquitin-conjugating enzyme E2 variant